MSDFAETRFGEDHHPAGNWSQDRRLKFIDFRLRWEGRINRTDLTDFFNISIPQASADLSRYTEAAPFNMVYDVKLKAYVKAVNFRPIFSRSASKTYLNELLALGTEIVESKSSFIGSVPALGVAPVPPRTLDGSVLEILLQAIRECRQVKVSYQGMKRAEPAERLISPHALGYDGLRWHVRTYCHLRNIFLDMVIGRLSDVAIGELSSIDKASDKQWHTMVTMILGPHPGLAPGGKKAIQMEYAMTDHGTLRLKCRQALLFYALRRFRLETIEDPDGAAAQQIILINRSELQPYIDELSF